LSALTNRSHLAGDKAGSRATVENSIVLVHNTTQYLKLHYSELIKCLLDNGWHVYCAAPKDSAVGQLEQMGAECIHITLSRRGMNALQEIAAMVKLFQVFRGSGTKAVLNFSIKPAIYGSIAAKLAGVPKICSMITGLGYVFSGEGKLREILSRTVRIAYRVALSSNRYVFFQNPDDRSYFMERRLVSSEQAVVLNGTGIDTHHFSPREAPEERDEGVRFLMIARLLLDKGIREYIEAARLLKNKNPSCHCALLGSRDDNPSAVSSDEIATWSCEDGFTYLGASDDVANVIAKYDVFVLPSYREGLPRATLEAMAMGKPVITTDVPGCRQTVIDGVNGYLVAPRDAKGLANAMSHFVSDPSLVTSMGRRSRDIAVGCFDVHVVNEEIVRRIQNHND